MFHNVILFNTSMATSSGLCTIVQTKSFNRKRQWTYNNTSWLIELQVNSCLFFYLTNVTRVGQKKCQLSWKQLFAALACFLCTSYNCNVNGILCKNKVCNIFVFTLLLCISSFRCINNSQTLFSYQYLGYFIPILWLPWLGSNAIQVCKSY